MADEATHERRIGGLEADVRQVLGRTDQAAEREARLGRRRNPRLAKTVEGGVSYPAAGSTPNTYSIVFQDGTFTETDGDRTPTYTARQAAAAAVAHYPDSEPYEYLPEGTIVVVLFDNGRWWIVGAAAAGKAESITFTTTEDMGDTLAGQAAATINDYYRGSDPAEAGFHVHDPQGIFPRALSGAKGKATYDDRSDEYHITECQQMATVCGCSTNAAVASGDATFTVTGVEVMFPIVGQLPTVANVRNTFGDTLSNAQPLIIGWNETDDAWDVLEVKRVTRFWVKAQTNWLKRGVGDSHDRAYVKRCDIDGSNETGAAFYIQLPEVDDQDPNVEAGTVLACGLMSDGSFVCLSDYSDDKINTIVWWSGTIEDIGPGWEFCDGNNGTVDLTRRMIMCVDETNGLSDEDDIGDTGGHRWHGETENNHADHPDHLHKAPEEELHLNAIDGAVQGASTSTDSDGDTTSVVLIPKGVFGWPEKITLGASQREGITDEVQTLTFSGNGTGGNFTLTLDNEWGNPVTTAAIAWDATAAEVEAAIDAVVDTYDDLFVTVAGPQINWTGEELTVTFNYLGVGAPPHTLITYNLGGVTGGTPALSVERTTTVPVENLHGHLGDGTDGHDGGVGAGADPHAGDDIDTDNRPPFYILAAKQRIDNSA